MKLGIRRPVGLARWLVFAVCGLAAVPFLFGVLVLVLGMGGTPSPFPITEITHKKPYADFIGREYRVAAPVRATAWNDFPDKAKILLISLEPVPGAKNRFVSYVTPLKLGQRVRIERAYQRFGLIDFNRHYVVSVPGAGLPDGIQIRVYVKSDGVPDPLLYEPVDK